MRLVRSLCAGALAAFPCASAVRADAPVGAWRARVSDTQGVAPGDDRLPPPPDARPITDRPPEHAQEPKIIYLAMDGIELTKGQDDSTTNTSALCGGSFPPYGEGQKREATLQATYKDWDRYNVILTTEQPSSGAYTTAVVSNVSREVCGYNSGGIFGVAPMDCGDEKNNVVFAFHAADDQYSADQHATVISQEVAHSYGLDHTRNQNGIMNPSPSGQDQYFDDTCQPNAGSVFCADQHAQYCDPSQLIQNSHAELVGILGEKAVPTDPPSVTIDAPADGQAFGIGEDVVVTASAASDGQIRDVQLEVDGEAAGPALGTAPYEWSLVELPEGEHTLVAVAADTAGNTAQSDPVAIWIGEGNGSGTGGPPGDDTGGDGDGWPPLDPGDGSSEEGCGCTQPRPSPAPWAAGVPVLLVLRRRSRPG